MSALGQFGETPDYVDSRDSLGDYVLHVLKPTTAEGDFLLRSKVPV
jgi:hypothetical protein